MNYFISVRTKEDGFLFPKLTDEANLKAAYELALPLSEGGAIFVHEATLDKETHCYVIGKEIDMNSFIKEFNTF